MVCHPISNTDVASDMTRISKLFTKSVLFAHPYMVTDSTMAHRPMLKQVRNAHHTRARGFLMSKR
jgi:hypothetical protein